MEQRMGELAACEESLAIRRRLARIDPSNAQWRHDEACILDHIGNVYREAGNTQEAIAAYEGGVAIWRQLANLARRDRHRQLNISMSLKKLGDVRLDAADHEGAIAAYEEGVVFWRRILKRDPDNTRWLSHVAESLERIGDLRLEAGHNKGALTAYEEMLSIDQQLVAIDDSNTEWQWNFSLSLDRIGEVNLILGNLNAAGAACDESLAIRRRLVYLDPSNALWREGVSLILKKIVEFRRVVEANAAALAEDEGPRIDLLSGANKIRAELQEQLSRNAGSIRKAKDVTISKALVAYEESLAIARKLVQQSATLRVGEVLRKLSLWYPELNASARNPLRRYWRGGEAFVESLSPKVRAGVQGFEHATVAVRLALKRLLSEWANSHNSPALDGALIALNSQPDPLQFDRSAEAHGTGLPTKEITASATVDNASVSSSIDATQNTRSAPMSGDLPSKNTDAQNGDKQSSIKRSRKRRRRRRKSRNAVYPPMRSAPASGQSLA